MTKIDIQDINNIITEASAYMDKGQIECAVELINKGLMQDSNNYELIFMKALCLEQEGCISEAYYMYKLAIFLSKDTEDGDIIKIEYDRMCRYSDTDEYSLGKALESLVKERIHMGEYNNTYNFLKEILYVKNKIAVDIAATYENMLLFMMLEISLCERNSGIKEEQNIFRRYDYELFEKIFIKVRLALRRIRFGLAYSEQKELEVLMLKYNITGDMLAVIIEYAIDPACWYVVMDKAKGIIENKCAEQAEVVGGYMNWILSRGDIPIQQCYDEDNYNNNAELVEINCNKFNINNEQSDKDYHKINIIFCTNDDLYCEECVRYIRRLRIPDGMKLEITAVKKADSMTSGYNIAMHTNNAGYKIYIHQDTFIIDTYILDKIVKTFESDHDIGLIGNSGTVMLPKDGIWWSDKQNNYKNWRGNLYQDLLLNTSKLVTLCRNGRVENAVAIDGIFMATSKDITWREDVFNGWHFYDISQTYEFRRAGYKTVFLNDDKIALLHEVTSKKDPYNKYEEYRQKFLQEYMYEVK